MKKLIFLLLIVCSPALGALTDNQELWLKFEDDFPSAGVAEDFSGHAATMLRFGWGNVTTNFPTTTTGKRGAQAAAFTPYWDTHPWGGDATNFIIGQYGGIVNLAHRLHGALTNPVWAEVRRPAPWVAADAPAEAAP